MRLIDADELKTRMLDYYCDSWRLCEEIHDFFANTPTVDEINACGNCKWARLASGLEKHGHWIAVGDQVAKCSLCGMLETTNGKDKTGQALIHKAVKRYCPNCGAKMDEVSE